MVLIATVLVIGMLVGLVVVRDSVVQEMEDVAEAIGAMQQSYTFNGIQTAANDSLPLTAGSSWADAVDVPAGDMGLVVFDVSPGTDEAATPPMP